MKFLIFANVISNCKGLNLDDDYDNEPSSGWYAQQQ